MKVFGITGWKNSGKTTLVVKLVEHFAAQGLRVATVKHAHHDFDIDIPNTDSYRHRKAGAQEVIVVSQRRWAIIHELQEEPEPGLQSLLDKLGQIDLVLIEGYKIETHPKLQVIRAAESNSRLPMSEQAAGIVAIASDQPESLTQDVAGCVLLDLNNTAQIADFIWDYLETTP